MRLNFLNKKEKEKLNNLLSEKYGFEIKGQIIKQSKDRLKIFSGNLSESELNFLKSILRIETIGLYFAFYKNSNFRISFDSCFLAKNAKKNLIILDEKQAKEWFSGREIELNEEQKKENFTYDYVLLKYNEEIVGCGKLTGNKILNFVPKERRSTY